MIIDIGPIVLNLSRVSKIVRTDSPYRATIHTDGGEKYTFNIDPEPGDNSAPRLDISLLAKIIHSLSQSEKLTVLSPSQFVQVYYNAVKLGDAL